MRFVKEENGQMLVITLLGMTVLMGVLAFAADVGMLFRAKREAQVAADAAAIAGALEYEYNGATNVSAKAKAAGVANGTTAGNVTVNLPPQSGYHTGSGYVEVVANMPTSTIFLSTFNSMLSPGSTTGAFNVSARSVAGITPSPACIYVLDPVDANTLRMQGNSSIIAPNCGIMVDSSSADALCVTGGSNTVNAAYIWITGGQNPAGHCKKTPSGTAITTGVLAQNDPFGDNPGPSLTNCNSNNIVSAPTITNATTILETPLTDAAGKTSELTCFSSPNVTLSGGLTLGSLPSKKGQIFLFENGVQIGGTVTVNGTMDIYQGQFKQGTSALTINAPGSDDDKAAKSLSYNGIALMQPSSNTTDTCQTGQTSTPCLQVQFGSSNGNLNGLIYAPTSQVFLQDNGGGTVVTGVIAYTLFNKSSTLSITNSYNNSHPGTTPLSSVQMVE